jgi:hypothetical protein
MTADLKDQIHVLMERGVQRVSAQEAAGRAHAATTAFPAEGARPGLRSRRTAAVTCAAAAVGCAGALVATQLGGPGAAVSGHRARPVLAAAFVRNLASASRIALAHSGKAVITTGQTQGGVSQGTSTDTITFSGRNWNDSLSEVLPASDGAPGRTQSAINRVVNGQAYDYFVASHGLAWYHDTGPDAVASMAIPDPRELLSELSPDAQFLVAGYSVVDGVRLEHLRATHLSGLPAIQLGSATPSGHLTALDIWADSKGVVHQMSLTTSQATYLGTISLNSLKDLKGVKVIGLARLRADKLDGKVRVRAVLWAGHGKRPIIVVQGTEAQARQQILITRMVVNFLDIGQPQVIKVPAHAIPVFGLG